MRIVVSPEAKQELLDAREYYEEQMPGLGALFAEEINSTIDRLRRWPLAYPCERGEIRRGVVRRFPYKILYSVESNYLFVVAVANHHREPRYWVAREIKPRKE